MVGDLLDDAFNVRWEQHHLLSMTNLMSELYPFLSFEHLEALKVSLVVMAVTYACLLMLAYCV